jgi:putative nucleotidyltransferase with HDIG domain
MEAGMDGIIQVVEFAMGARDPYTVSHQQRVAYLACALAREMGLPPDRVEALHIAGSLHDLGKIAVPLEILSKPGKLNEIEFAMIKTHPQVGNDILQPIKFPGQVSQMILQHHERLDGSGYPMGLKGEDILLEARILGVADVVEAMCSHRPYRPSLGLDKALEEISRHRGTLYDPLVVDACLKLYTEELFRQTFEVPALSTLPQGAYRDLSVPRGKEPNSPGEPKWWKRPGSLKLFPESWDRFYLHATFALILMGLMVVGSKGL